MISEEKDESCHFARIQAPVELVLAVDFGKANLFILVSQCTYLHFKYSLFSLPIDSLKVQHIFLNQGIDRTLSKHFVTLGDLTLNAVLCSINFGFWCFFLGFPQWCLVVYEHIACEYVLSVRGHDGRIFFLPSTELCICLICCRYVLPQNE